MCEALFYVAGCMCTFVQVCVHVLIITCELLCACYLCAPLFVIACAFECACLYPRELVCECIRLYTCLTMHASVYNIV